MHSIKNDFTRGKTKDYEHKGDRIGTKHRYTDTLTKSRMEALSVLQREVERLQERRGRLTKGILRTEQRMENDGKWEKEVILGSLEESARRSRAATEERGRITKIREKIGKVDRQIRM